METRAKSIFDEYTHLYSVSKTLRFELIPQGKTQEYIEKNGILEEDFHRQESYKRVKKILDRYYKDFISTALATVQLNGLEEYAECYYKSHKNAADEKILAQKKSDLRKNIIEQIESQEEYESLFNKDLILKCMPAYCTDPEELALLDEFKSFTTYFVGFWENRRNIFSPEGKATSLAFRAVDQNLARFLDNIRCIEEARNTGKIWEQLLAQESEYTALLGELSFEDFFTVQNYDQVLSNERITLYNSILGGFFTEGTEKKVQGINELINLYNQQNKKGKRLPVLQPLYKQILADRSVVSFLPEQFESDNELINSLKEYSSYLQETVLLDTGDCSYKEVMGLICSADKNHLFIRNDASINTISNALFGDWSVIKTALEEEYDRTFGAKVRKKNEQYYEKRSAFIRNRKSFSVGEIESALGNKGLTEKHIIDYYSMASEICPVPDLIFQINRYQSELERLLGEEYIGNLIRDKKTVAAIKCFLDSILALSQFYKPLCGAGGETDKDAVFYGRFNPMYDVISSVIGLYNKIRNYVTRKPYSTEKIKLNFQNYQLLSGWDKNKEKDCYGSIFLKDGNYYLAIAVKKYNKTMAEVPEYVDGPYYSKMEYKLLPGASKMLPKVFLSKKGVSTYHPSQEIIEAYKKGTHKKNNPAFSLDDCHRLINYFKDSIDKNPDWSVFGFTFTDTDQYKEMNDFYREVEEQGYLLKFRRVSQKWVDEMVESGKLYLFQIYNKDFSPYSKGTPNLHTIYWKLLFHSRNLENVIYKLNGQAEVFYRKASIDASDVTIHPKNVSIDKKNPEAAAKHEKSLFPYDLIKDKRYTIDKYQFHVPITMNFCAEGTSRINEMVQATIREHHDINVIGIDRGERNLLYVSVVSPDGKILHQESMNTVHNDKGYDQDYHRLLSEREKERSTARLNWGEIASIKELKEGYLSQVFHRIVELMFKYEAILVMEDLNFGFVNGRKKVEKQVYQKFEKMLIDKLNYYVNKSYDLSVPAGALNACQLTEEFQSFSRMGKQSGFLFYVPAWNTSKIDPTTGFVDLLHPRYTNITDAKTFINKFKDIRYNPKGYFEFEMRISDFTDRAYGERDHWVLCSYGKRVKAFRNKEKNLQWDYKELDLTQEFMELFSKYQIDVNGNIKEQITAINEKEFWVNLIGALKLLLQMRNSIAGTATDFLISPVMNEKGRFYDSRKGDLYGQPKDADANGAYNIARKGLWVMEQIRNSESGRIKLAMSNQEWLSFAQSRPLN